MRCLHCNKEKHKNILHDYNCPYMPQCLMKDVELRETHALFNIKVGMEIKIENEKGFWKILTKNDRFLICIKNKSYIICDLYECIYGVIDKISFNEINNKTDEILKRLNNNIHISKDITLEQLEISYNTYEALKILEIKEKRA